MSDTLESLSRQQQGATDLGSVVRTMKTLAASNIGQYEMAVNALKDYDHCIQLGLNAWFRQQKPAAGFLKEQEVTAGKTIYAVVFGSDQGLVGRFNDSMADFAKQKLAGTATPVEFWAVGERMYARMKDAGIPVTFLFKVPNSVSLIVPLIGDILLKTGQQREKGLMNELYIFYNTPVKGSGYEPAWQRLLPLDQQWEQQMAAAPWPTNNLPRVAGNVRTTLTMLINEYLFVSLFKACAESLASENASLLAAMQRAEKNIGEMLDELRQSYNRLRQSSIDEELLDVIAGFEALKGIERKVDITNKKNAAEPQ